MKETDKILDNLRRQCSRREYCTADVFEKAEKALGGDTEAAEEVVRTLVAEKYVDNLRYASAYAREKSSISGWGAVKIRYMLSGKGIDKDVISLALDEVDDERSQSRLVKLMETKSRSLKDDPQKRMKLLRFALGRGYSYQETESILNTLLSP